MADNFGKFYSQPGDPAKKGAAVTPNDSANLAFASTYLYVGNTGNVNVIMAGDTANTVIPFLAPGIMHALRVQKVWAAGTSATNIVAFN